MRAKESTCIRRNEPVSQIGPIWTTDCTPTAFHTDSKMSNLDFGLGILERETMTFRASWNLGRRDQSGRCAWHRGCCSVRTPRRGTPAQDYAGNQGVTLYVSKLGDNSDGLSWATAFTTIQTALSRVPDAQGGHRVIVRPDTYMEANLYVPYSGAPGSYNLLIGDTDGRHGSGTQGRVVIDSGDASKGFKSYDWWSTIRATAQGWSPEHKAPTFSSILWDRWIVRNSVCDRCGCRALLGLHEPGRAVHDCCGRLREHRARVRRWRGKLPVALRRTDHVPPLQAVVAGRVGRHGRTLHSR